MIPLKQSTAVTVKIGPFVDATDQTTPETGLSPAVEISKAGGAFAGKSEGTTPAHDAEGWYDCNLDATDTATLGRLILKSQDSSHQPVYHEFYVLAANVFDSLFAGTDYLDVDGANIWAYARRTLTNLAGTASNRNGAVFDDLIVGATYDNTISGLTISASWSKCYVTIKRNLGDDDALALVQIVDTNGGDAGDGLLYIGGQAPTDLSLTAADAEITVNQGAGTIQIVISDEATNALSEENVVYVDIKLLISGGTSQSLVRDTPAVIATATKAVS